MHDGPIREGNRGGLGDFRWSNVVNDRHRDNYLGSTVNAPQGRWQKNQDIHWYTRDKVDTDEEAAAKRKRAELKALKDAEEEALSVALGFAPQKKDPGTGSNGVPVKTERDEEIERLEREEKKKDKALRKELRALKRAEKELRREDRERERDIRRSRRYENDDRRDRDRDRSRSRSRSRDRDRYRERSTGDDGYRERSREKESGRRRESEREKRWKGSTTPPMLKNRQNSRSASPVREGRSWIVDDDE